MSESIEKPKDKKTMYIRVVVCCCILMMTNLGSSSTFSVCLPKMVDFFGVPRALISTCSTMCSLGALLCFLVQGTLIKKITPRRVALLGTFGGIVHYAGYIFSSNIYICWVCGFLGGIGSAYCGAAVLSILLTNWFVKYRAQMITLVTALGVGYIALTSRIAGVLVNAYSFQVSYAVWTGTIILFGIPAALLLINTPADVGMKAFGQDKLEQIQASQVQKPVAGLTLSEARKTASFWLLSVAMVCMGLAPAIFRFLVDFWTSDCGFEHSVAANMYSYMNLISAAFLLIYGRVTDKMGGKVFSIMVGICSVGGTLLLLKSSPAAMVVTIIGLILYGATSNHAMGNGYPTLNTIGIFGTKEYKAIIGFTFIPVKIGAALSNTIIGGVKDITGSYSGAFIFCAGLGALALVCVLLAYRLSPYKEVTLSQMEKAAKAS